MKTKKIKLDAIVREILPDFKYKIEIIKNNNIIIGYLSGSMRKNYIRLFIGDKIIIDMSIYDKNKARIIYKYN